MNWEQESGILTLALPDIFVTLSKSLHLSGSQFPEFLKNRLNQMISAFLWLLNSRILGFSFIIYYTYLMRLLVFYCFVLAFWSSPPF